MWFVIGMVAGAGCCWAGRDLLRAERLQRINVRGRTVPTAGGVLAVGAILLVTAIGAAVGALEIGRAHV